MGLHPAVSAQRPPDSPHGHADTGPPLSGVVFVFEASGQNETWLKWAFRGFTQISARPPTTPSSTVVLYRELSVSLSRYFLAF